MNKIKILAMDVDGTLTDGAVYIGENGEIMKAFDIKDGYALANMLCLHDITPVIITGRKSKIVENRAKELNIDYIFQGISDKKQKLHEICAEMQCDFDQVAYIGDDINDLDCIKLAALSGCPKNAVQMVKDEVDFVSAFDGGKGAVREFIEWIIDREEGL